MYQVVRCSECGVELSRTPYTGNTVTGADGTEYKTIEEAITAFNNQSAGSYTLTIADGEYAVNSMSLSQTVEGRSLTIAAETFGGVTLSAKETVTADKGIFTVDSDSKYRDNSPVVIKGINFDLSNVSDGILSAVTLGTGADRYAQNITLEDCHFVGIQDNSYAVDVNANAGAKNITIRNCTADNVRGLYGGYGDSIVIENCTLTNSKSVINSQSVITSMATEGLYNVQLSGITADIRADVQDKIYAVRISGGRTLIDDCDITMTYHSPDSGDDAVEYGLLVLRNAANTVDIRNSTLNAITDPSSVKKAYAIYQESSTATINIDAASKANLTGGVYPETLVDL